MSDTAEVRVRRKTLTREMNNSSFTLIRQTKANLELIQKQTEAQEWIQNVLDTRFPEDTDFPGAIEDGVLLCRLVLAIKPNCIKKINPTKARFKMMENIAQFVLVCGELGVPEPLLFTATDLTDRANLTRVVNCIHALADCAAKQGFQPKMDRLFSDEVTMNNTRANFANVQETASMRDAVTKLNYEKRVSIATVFKDSTDELPTKIEIERSVSEQSLDVPMTPEVTREKDSAPTDSVTEPLPVEASPVSTETVTDSTLIDSAPLSEVLTDSALTDSAPSLTNSEPAREPAPSLDLGIPDVMEDLLIPSPTTSNSEEPSLKKEKKKKKEKKEKKLHHKSLEKGELDEESERKRKEERRRRHKEKKERNTLPAEFQSPETSETSETSTETAQPASPPESDPNIRSWKKKAGTLTYTSSIQLGERKSLPPTEEEPKEAKLRSWKKQGNSIHQEDIERYYATHGFPDEESALSDSLKVRSWKERTKNTGYNSLNAIQKYYVNLKANDTDKVSLEEKIKENKENLIKRVEMRDANENSVKSAEEEAEEKRERMRVEVITEILLSERYFVRDMETIVFVFLKPLKNLEILTSEEMESLVSNVELILKVNKLILSSILKDYDESGNIQLINVGQAFYKQIDYLKIYGVYASNHTNAVKSYEAFKKKYKKFAEFMKEKESLPECQGINFLGFLIKPVQRLTKYHLLFRELLKHTPKDHPDYENIEKCFTKVQEVAAYVNERQRTSESIQKMVEIQENMVNTEKGFSVYHTDRVFVREGPVTITENEGEKPQELHYFLFNDLFLYCKTQLAKKATFKYRGQIDLGKCLIGELNPENEVSFQIMRLDGKKSMVVTLPHPSEKKSLFNEMSKLVEALMQNGGSLKSRSSMPVEGSPRSSVKDSPRLAQIRGSLSFSKLSGSAPNTP